MCLLKLICAHVPAVSGGLGMTYQVGWGIWGWCSFCLGQAHYIFYSLSTINSAVRCWRRVFSLVFSNIFLNIKSRHFKPFKTSFKKNLFMAIPPVSGTCNNSKRFWLILILFYHIVIPQENTMYTIQKLCCDIYSTFLSTFQRHLSQEKGSTLAGSHICRLK